MARKRQVSIGMNRLGFEFPDLPKPESNALLGQYSNVRPDKHTEYGAAQVAQQCQCCLNLVLFYAIATVFQLYLGGDMAFDGAGLDSGKIDCSRNKYRSDPRATNSAH